jgi:hypothetical protein
MGKDKRKNIGKDEKEMERLLGPKKPPRDDFSLSHDRQNLLLMHLFWLYFFPVLHIPC